jgi:hypothetical protein
MTLDVGFIASSAFAAADGHLSALGIGSDTFYSQPLADKPAGPASVSPGAVGSPISFSVVTRFAASRAEIGVQYRITIRIANGSDASVATGQISLTVPAARSDVPDSWGIPINVVVPLSFAPSSFGEYRVHIILASQSVKSMAFRVVPLAA